MVFVEVWKNLGGWVLKSLRIFLMRKLVWGWGIRNNSFLGF